MKSWSVEDGLPRSSVISVIQSHDGYLWLGTINGLVRFDGDHFTVFNQFNTPGLTSDQILYLFEDSQSNIWLGTESAGVMQVKDGQIEKFTPDGDAGKLVYACEDASTNVWFYTANGQFFRYQNGQMNFHPSELPAQLPLRAGRVLFASADDGIWRIQNGRIQKWNDKGLVKDFGAYPWADAPVTAMCEDGQGNLIVGTLKAGIFWFDADGHYHRISEDEGLSSKYVLSLCLDHEGNLWAGTDGGGLDRIKKKIFSTPEATHPWSLESLAQDTNGGIWMAFNARGLSYAISNSIQDFAVGYGSNAWSILVDGQQQIWAGTRYEGLFTFASYYFRHADGADGLGQQINALFQSHDGLLWAGTPNGLARWDGQNWKLFTTHDGLSENSIRAIAEDAQTNLWIGTDDDGLNVLRDGKFSTIRTGENSLPGDDVSCLFADRAGDLWIGTLGHGLARLHDGKWARFSSRDGLASNSIGFIIEDDDGNLWIGSNAGLMRVPQNSFSDFTDGNAKSLTCRIYTSADGLPTSECSFGAQPSAIRARDGDLWFPTAQGPAFVNPQALKQNNEPPPVVIESVRVDGVEQKTNQMGSTWRQSVTLPPGVEQLEIHYTSLNLAAPERALFKYWLEGHEKNWTDAGGVRVAQFPNLPPGNYKFHVTACNEDGVWNEAGSVLEVIVPPPFWRTWWFLLVAAIVLAAVVVGTVHLISTQKFRRKLRQQESLEKERSRIARDLHDQLGANLTQVTLLGEMTEADKNLPDEVELNAKQICVTARETTRSLDEIVWAVNPANDTLEGLANYACKYAQDYFALAGVRYRVDVPVQLPPVELLPDVRHNVFLAFKEAVNNVVKHAQATEAQVRLQLQENQFTLAVEDNGRGLGNLEAARLRNGLKNMRQRLADVHGEFSIAPGTSGGTRVTLTVPLGSKII